MENLFVSFFMIETILLLGNNFLVLLINQPPVSFMDNRLVDFSDNLLVDDRLVDLLDDWLVVLVSDGLDVFLDLILVVLVDHILVSLSEDGLFDLLLVNWLLKMLLDFRFLYFTRSFFSFSVFKNYRLFLHSFDDRLLALQILDPQAYIASVELLLYLSSRRWSHRLGSLCLSDLLFLNLIGPLSGKCFFTVARRLAFKALSATILCGSSELGSGGLLLLLHHSLEYDGTLTQEYNYSGMIP